MTNFLTAEQIRTGEDGTIVPAEEFAVFRPDCWDQYLFIGHIDAAEAQRRITVHEQLHGGLQLTDTKVIKGEFFIVRESLWQRWVLFERHSQDCPWRGHDFAADPDIDESEEFDHCYDCRDFTWHPNRVPEGTPGAVAVTTAFAWMEVA